MAVTIKHNKVATLPDEPGAEVNKAEWNEAHAVLGLGTAAEAATTDFDAAGAATAAVVAHEAAGDPHAVYQKESEKGAVSGYAGLDAGGKVPTAQLGSGVADASTFLRGDQSYAVPGASSTNIKAVNVTVAATAIEASFTIADADVSPASQINLSWGNCAQSEANHPGMGEVSFNAVAGSSQFIAELYSLDRSTLFGDFKLNYLVG